MTQRVVAIHQPNFFPWLGYFDKIARADVFVVLDTVQLPGGAGTWLNRVKLLVAGADRWVTAPLRRESSFRSIRDVSFDESKPWRRKLIATVQASYSRAPHYRDVVALIEELIAHQASNLAAYNLHAIQTISGALGLDTSKIVQASDLPGEGASNALLISLVKSSGGTAYLCGGGASGYQDDALFAAAGVRLRYQDFRHPSYAQQGSANEFKAGLSILDALANLGLAGTASLIGRTGVDERRYER